MSVLGTTEINDAFERLFRRKGNRENIRAAKYFLTLSKDNLILPNGTRYREGEECVTSFTLSPGQTAFVSTAEWIRMPPDLMGIIGPRFNSAEHGILFFGGMVVDPGYGLPQGGQPLSFHIANMGDKPIELRPGKDSIASIVFLTVEGSPDESRLSKEGDLAVLEPEEARKALMGEKEQRPPGALGQIGSLRQVQERVDKMEASVEQVVMLGIIVVIGAIIGAVTATLFSLAPDSEPERDVTTVKHVHGVAEPHITHFAGTGEPWWILPLTLVAIALVAIALAATAFFHAKVRAKKNELNRRIRLSEPYPSADS